MMLQFDPAQRITAEESLAHPWFDEDGGGEGEPVAGGSGVDGATGGAAESEAGAADGSGHVETPAVAHASAP